MRRIVLPGSGNCVTFCSPEDSNVTVRANGKLITVNLQANVATRIEFLDSLVPTCNLGIAA